MIFAQKLEVVALIDLASVLCARKFSFDPQRDLPAAERPQHCVLVGSKIHCLWWHYMVLAVLAFLGQKYIACGDIICFLAKKLPFEPISSKPRIRF